MAGNSDTGISKFERAVSYVLITGVITSLIIEVVGIVSFYAVYGQLNILESKGAFLHGNNFFSFLSDLIQGKYPQKGPLLMMSLGIAILILTPYVRVVMSVLYFTRERNIKYALITLFVLILLTMSLTLQ
jgi:uncharacterized membrane protein